jgi:uncharacterized protein (DUF4415 family)
MGKSYKSGKGYGRKDWDAVSDNPKLTDEQISKAKPFAEAMPELAASIRRGLGPNKAPTKKLVSLRLSGQVIEKYKAGGPGWIYEESPRSGEPGESFVRHACRSRSQPFDAAS